MKALIGIVLSFISVCAFAARPSDNRMDHDKVVKPAPASTATPAPEKPEPKAPRCSHFDRCEK